MEIAIKSKFLPIDPRMEEFEKRMLVERMEEEMKEELWKMLKPYIQYDIKEDYVGMVVESEEHCLPYYDGNIEYKTKQWLEFHKIM